MTMRARAHLGEDFVFAIELPGEGLIGGSACKAERQIHGRLWIGKPYWGAGYADRGPARVRQWKREVVGELDADHFVDNLASGRVLEKARLQANGRDRAALLARARGKIPGAQAEARAFRACGSSRPGLEACLA